MTEDGRQEFLSDLMIILGLLVGAVFTMIALIVTLILPESPEFGMLGGRLIIYVSLVSFGFLFGSLGIHVRLRFELIGDAPPKTTYIWDVFANYTFDLGVMCMTTALALIAYIFADILAATILIIVLWGVDLMFILANKASDSSPQRSFSILKFIRGHISIFVKAVVLIVLYLDFLSIFPWRNILIPL